MDRGPGTRGMVGKSLAGAATAKEVDDGQQHDRAKERHEQRTEAVIAGHDVAAADQRVDDNAREKRADYADDDVEQKALLAVRAHDQTGKPAQHAADDDENDDTQVAELPMQAMQG